MAMTRAALLAAGCDALARAGIGEAKEEAERILGNVLKASKAALFLDAAKEVAPEAERHFLRIVEERKTRKPLAYLLGEACFGEEILEVSDRCLIPRPETEILVEALAKQLAPEREFSFLDLGTGSGAIAIALMRKFPLSKGTLSDISEEALGIARRNLGRYGLENRALLKRGDLFGAFAGEEPWDVVVSNPPYLSEGDFRNLQPELAFEPRLALDGGTDGFDFYRRIIPEARRYLKPGGFLALEAGAGQADQVSKWLQGAGYDNILRFKDYLGFDRVVMARINEGLNGKTYH
ncbi:MAG TPA: peptide chain release factor N(5)-glutamine methyltransferase [Candidatus Omnitrophota bacterium]|jgi:release factor glutamine methyltransferase|nr:peptide chain release factor N(5)-glutamine methyltransferase [Candidatus Omnitrophota bacterium]